MKKYYLNLDPIYYYLFFIQFRCNLIFFLLGCTCFLLFNFGSVVDLFSADNFFYPSLVLLCKGLDKIQVPFF